MRSIAVCPSLALLAGITAGIAWARPLPGAQVLLVAIYVAALAAWWRGARTSLIVIVALGSTLAGLALGAAAARAALQAPLRSALENEGPIVLHARLIEDAAPREFGASLRAEAAAIVVGGRTVPVSGGVRITVSGSLATARVEEWTAGRVIAVPASFRRPTRYLNDGVPDFERDLALDGVALLASVKSALLMQVLARGSAFEERAARLRAVVRSAVARHVTVRDPVAGAIVTAILIGDRTALPDAVRDRLQAAGTYHVIAISGGNIAIVAALLTAMLLAAGAGRAAPLGVIAGLAGYAAVVSSGPSVWRATTMAVVYLAARAIDHRSPPWNTMAMTAALLVCAAPLDLRDAGFLLTFGATAAILEAAHRVGRRRGVMAWVLAGVAASLAAEVVLLPISATVFSRVTAAGLVLNLLAVPLMTVVQIAGLAVVALSALDALGSTAGTVAAAGARGLVESARLVDVWPWLSHRVPPPGLAVVAAYYLALGCALWLRRGRPVWMLVLAACGIIILTGVAPSTHDPVPPGRLRLTMFDVGQGESLLLQTPAGRALLVDTAGAGFDGTAFDIGGRVLAPALWARGVRRLHALAITHGDPDHLGGAASVLRDFAPRELWEGIPVPGHLPLEALASAAAVQRAARRTHLAGAEMRLDDVRIRVLHPPPADWERRRVRNDDSLVFEIRHGDVAILLTGDIGAGVERTLLPRLDPAPIRILKVAHHGSRTSTSQVLLDAWRPQIALISCGRGNRFGHPAPEVIRRLEAAGAEIYRTDRDGQVTVVSDGNSVDVRRFLSRDEE